MPPLLICSHCSNNLTYHSYGEKSGLLTCENCNIHAPKVDGIIYYNELDIVYQSNEIDFFESFRKKIETQRDEYKKFIHNKISRNLIDPYSAFQPFNESSRSFYPFINDLKEKLLKPGDLILDTWCRTGWTGYFLASIFPEQKVVSVWEGNKDVLGYAGFDYWLNSSMRPNNLSLIHLDLNKPLPFEDNTFKLVHGLDTLHRYDQTNLVSELLRVTVEEGALIFPHIHLTNSMPEPFFERGEKQIHGTEWERFFEKRLKNTSYKAFVLSEPSLFDLDQSKPIKSEPNTTDYNGLIAILPDNLSWVLSPYQSSLSGVERVIVNPYLSIDLNEASVNIDPNYLNGAVGKMLERHPVYYDRVKHLSDYTLTPQEVQLLYLARHNSTIAEIIEKLNAPMSSLVPVIEKLIESEIIQVLPLPEEAINLQLFHAAIPFFPRGEKQTIYHLLNESRNTDTNDPIINVLTEEAELGSEDVNYLINRIKSRLMQLKIDRGDCIFICSKPHFESILVLWSALEMGIEVSVVSTDIPDKAKVSLIKERGSKGCFFDTETFLALVELISEAEIVVMDDENDQIPNEHYFSNWIELAPEELVEYPPIPSPDNIAVTLYSSGTTGKPKGIRLSHRTLFKSGKTFAENYGWTSADKIIMITELDSMSGLRNVAIASAFSQTTIVIPLIAGSNNILSVVEGIKMSKATILTCTPALIKQFIKLSDRIEDAIKSLRQVLCTGGNLSPSLVGQFEMIFNVRILNYYGLTETCGLCIGETPDNMNNKHDGSIGKPIDSIAQLVDEDNKLVATGDIGRLRIFNDRLMNGYLNKSESDLKIKDGWLYTGDLATKNKEGMFFLKGRERNIIKDTSGNIIYLSEIENTLMSHPLVQDVEVLKREDDEIESLLASVLLKDSSLVTDKHADDLKSFVRTELGINKIPVIDFVDKLERDGRGNVKRSKSEVETGYNYEE